MASISTTDLKTLEALFVAAIEGITPRQTYQGAEPWKHYEKATDSASRTRRFTIRWGFGRFVSGGYFTNAAVETEVPMSVRVDYAGQHENLTHLVQDDWLQIRDVLAALHADPANGLTQLHTTDSPPARAADTAQGRSQLSDRAVASSNTFQIDLTYRVRYQQARAAA